MTPGGYCTWILGEGSLGAEVGVTGYRYACGDVQMCRYKYRYGYGYLSIFVQVWISEYICAGMDMGTGLRDEF